MSEEGGHDSGPKAVAKYLESPDMQAKFVKALPPDVSVDRFTRVVMTAISMKPELLEADRTSLYTSCLTAAKDGLVPDGREGVLNVFSTNVGTKQSPRWIKKVQWMPMIEGVIKQMAKAGISVYAASVYANDQIRVWNDDRGQHVEHTPVLFGERGARIGAYAVGRTKSGHVQVEAMNADDLAKARAASKNADGAIYQLWGDRMEQKTCAHRLRKRMAILDPEIAEALRRDEEEGLDDPPLPEGAPTPTTEIPEPGRRSRTLQAVVDHDRQEGEPDIVTTVKPEKITTPEVVAPIANDGGEFTDW